MQDSTSTGSGTAESNKGVAVFPLGQMALFAMVIVLFFLWGMSNNLTDILVQQFKKSFELSKFSAQLVSTANFTGYACMAVPAALVMRRWGYKAGMVSGLCLFGVGLLMFWPAAVSGKYSLFLVALFAVGCSLAILETAANPFVAQFGPTPTSERRLNFAQSFNPPGTILGVLVGRTFILSGVELTQAQVAAQKAAGTYAGYLHGEIMRVVPTYIALGSVVLLFAFALSRMHFPKILSEHEGDTEGHGSFRALLHYPQLWFAVAANVCNVGAQISVWSNIIFYMKAYTTIDEKTAANYIVYSLVAMLAGRFISTPIMKHVAPSKLLGLYGAINVLLMTVTVTHPGMLGAWTIVASSFFLGIMFPTIFALGLKGLGENTKLGGSFLVLAIVGGAFFPLLLGRIADSTGSMALGYLVPLFCYAGVAVYGFAAPLIQPRPGKTDPEAGMIAAEFGQGF
ncbi:MAG TPA: L-fucose:H+ symporter permease [Acidobacteriaceae bacterium]|jgi:FHS family L-fucose permease-like MFS transporter|nr:L-fucose:H+ symporter permease [Acidobacteriaceae bacterium]